MSAPLLIGIFLFIVFAPCLAAFGQSLEDSDPREKEDADSWHPAGELEPAAIQAMEPEVALAQDFSIRSFPKGLSQRRLLLRDSDGAVRLSIAQLRRAAAELVRLGGRVAAYELAQVAAATAAAMTSVRDAFAVAARQWVAWAEAVAAQNQHRSLAWETAPPERGSGARRWREIFDAESQAA